MLPSAPVDENTFRYAANTIEFEEFVALGTEHLTSRSATTLLSGRLLSRLSILNLWQDTPLGDRKPRGRKYLWLFRTVSLATNPRPEEDTRVDFVLTLDLAFLGPGNEDVAQYGRCNDTLRPHVSAAISALSVILMNSQAP